MSRFVSFAPLNLVHSNVWGPFLPISNKGYRYYVSFVDDYSKFTWLFSLIYKSNVNFVLQKFISFVENLLSISVKIFYSNDGGELYTFAIQNLFST